MRLPNFRVSSLALVAVVAAFAIFMGRGFLHRADYPVEPGQQVDPPSAFTAGEPNLVGAMFYSAWCSSCAVLDPKLRKIAPEFEGRAVRFVKFDFSMGPNDAQAAKAAALRVSAIYEANKGATGFMALIDSRTQASLGTVYMTDSDAKIRDTINAAIRAASRPLETASLTLVAGDELNEYALAN